MNVSREHTIEELSGELQRIDPPAFPAVERVHYRGEPRSASDRSESGTGEAVATYRGAVYRRVGNTTFVPEADPFIQGLPATRSGHD